MLVIKAFTKSDLEIVKARQQALYKIPAALGRTTTKKEVEGRGVVFKFEA